MVPACVELFASDAALLCFLLLEKIERKPSQCGQILRCVARPSSALIFAKTDVHDPVDFILHAPVAAHRSRKGRHIHRQAR